MVCPGVWHYVFWVTFPYKHPCKRGLEWKTCRNMRASRTVSFQQCGRHTYLDFLIFSNIKMSPTCWIKQGSRDLNLTSTSFSPQSPNLLVLFTLYITYFTMLFTFGLFLLFIIRIYFTMISNFVSCKGHFKWFARPKSCSTLMQPVSSF